MNTEERFIALEMKLAYLEDAVKTLDTVVREQAAEIEELKKEGKFLTGKVADLMETEGPARPDRRPPHY